MLRRQNNRLHTPSVDVGEMKKHPFTYTLRNFTASSSKKRSSMAIAEVTDGYWSVRMEGRS